jgi:hypothetical protein
MGTAELFGNYIARIVSMQNQLDEYFGGKIVLPHLTAEQNKARMEFHFSMSDRLMPMLDRVGNCLVDSLGGRQSPVVRKTLEEMAARVQFEPGTSSQEEGVRRVKARILDVAVERSKIFPQVAAAIGTARGNTHTAGR